MSLADLAIYVPASADEEIAIITRHTGYNAGRMGDMVIDGRKLHWWESRSPITGQRVTLYFDRRAYDTRPAGQASTPTVREDRSMSGAPLAAFAFGTFLFFMWLNRPEKSR